MARELPPNLDDGELWLPSEIIPEVASPRPIKCGAASAYDLDALAMELAALGFFDPCRIPNKPAPAAVPPLPALAKAFCPANRFGFGYEQYRAPAATGSFLQFGAVKLVQPQMVGGFGLGRGSVPPLPQTVVCAPAQFIPTVWANGPGRSCGGTGVFLPRAAKNEAKKRPGNGRSGGEQQRQAMKKKQVKGMQPLMQVQLPPELALPPEWTY